MSSKFNNKFVNIHTFGYNSFQKLHKTNSALTTQEHLISKRSS